MGLTSAMLIGFTGIKTNQIAIETIGDNVANVNTTAFKNQRALFETMLYHTLAGGTAPDANQGGTNPVQTGYGSALATIQRNFGQGSLDRTGVPSDLAIEGDGFFILAAPSGEQLYTRDGSFELNTENVLVASNGSRVQGFAAGANGEIIPGALGSLTIPVGLTSDAQATTSAALDGNLDAASSVADTAALATSAPLNTAAGPATAASALADLLDEDGNALFADGDVITVSEIEKGGAQLAGQATFTVGADGTTLGDFAAFLERALMINTDAAVGGTPGVTVTDGALVITSNLGQANAVSIDDTDIRNSTSGALPFTFASTPAAGEGVATAFLVNDSLGNPLEVRLRLALESQDDTGSVWRFYAESPGDTGGGVVGTGTISFDQNGRFTEATGTDISVGRAGTGATNPLGVSLDFSTLTGLAADDGESTLVMSEQNGRPPGTLLGYEIGRDGLIAGQFSNGAQQVFGQVALATFTNPEGLVGLSNNTFNVGVNSGNPVVVAPQTLGAGRIEAGQLEQSNVDLSREFVGLITASTGFSAAGRVVRTADDLLQELLLLMR